MKKWQIGVLVLVAVLIVVLKLIQRSLDEPIKAPAPGQTGQIGIPLPEMGEVSLPDAQVPYAQAGFEEVDSKDANAESCSGVSLNNIFSDYGRLWGPTPNKVTVFPSRDQEIIESFVQKYYACRALLNRDEKICAKLPGFSDQSTSKESAFLSAGCKDILERIFSPGYMAGKEKDKKFCAPLHEWDGEGGFPVDDKDIFCSAASSGMENICPAFEKKLNNAQMRTCYAEFPRTQQDCGGNSESLERLSLYIAIKKSSPELCPPSLEEPCRAYISQKPSACSDIAKELTAKYCGYFRKLSEDTFGDPGIKHSEFVALLREKNEQVLSGKQEREKIISEINKRIKAMRKKP